MNVFYTKTSEWELDFFMNDIFNSNSYNVNINFILFDNNTIIENKNYNLNYKNVIVCNHVINLNYLESLINKLKPFVIFHLSDEYGKDTNYYKLYNKYDCIKILFHQYNFNNINYKTNSHQIPLGYVTGFLDYNKNNINNNKIHDFSFVGALKSDRLEMLKEFYKKFKKKNIKIGRTNWSDPNLQNVKPADLFDIYNNSVFVPIGRGNISLDCFRLYETIVAGAVPVICGTNKEIDLTFNYNNNGMPELIIGENWEEAVSKCEKIYNDKDKINEIINKNNKWWERQISEISIKIKKLL